MKKLGHNVKIIAIPSFYGGKMLADIDLNYLEQFDFKDVIYPCGKSLPYNRCQPLDGTDFDSLFISTPYDSFSNSPLDPHYLTKNLKKITKKVMMVVYGPHIFHQDTINDPNLPKIIDIMFVDSKSTKDIYVNRYRFSSDKVIVSGYQPYKNIRDLKRKNTIKSDRLTLLWLPRWWLSFNSRKTFEGGSTFLSYHHFFYNYMKNNPDINLIIRPHVLLNKNSIDDQFLNQKDLDNIFQRFESLKNIKISKHEKDSLDKDILSADIVISDGTSALAEVVVADKPIIYLSNGWNNEFNSNDLSKEFIKHLFIAYMPLDIINFIKNIKEKNYRIYSEDTSIEGIKKTLSKAYTPSGIINLFKYVQYRYYRFFYTRKKFKEDLDPVENPAQFIAEYLLKPL